MEMENINKMRMRMNWKKGISKYIIMILLLTSALSAEVFPLGKNVFEDTKTGSVKVIDSDFIVVAIKPNGAGRYFYVDSYKAGNTIVWSAPIASGRPGQYDTPSGIFKIYHKKRKWMSTKYPDESGRNNMNYSMFFKGGFALHQGNPRGLSHGCVHLSRKDAKMIFETIDSGTPVIITRQNYSAFVTSQEQAYIYKASR